MAAARKTKLFKIASEINIGKDAIIEFLQSKGFDVQNKPTATLTPDMVDSVHEKFKKEIKAAEKQREKLQRHKDTRKTVQQNEQDNASENAPEVESPAMPAEKETKSESTPTAKVEQEKVKPSDSDSDIKPGMVIDFICS